ncbi:MAG: SGNH/GDSL hydrolase family protein, partial [Candidatus Methylomirabilis sp.]|nr:SGNH/GDSL hydrolase family protein [Deltaproteobacteria bacterium]
RDLRRLRPELMVLNLGQNDKRPAALARAVEGFLALNEADGVRTLLVLEPRSLENPRLRLPGNHEALRRVAAAHGLEALDLHAYFAREDVRDLGLLWWDPGHLSGYGQRLFAERIAPDLLRALEAGPPSPTSAAFADRRPDGSSLR